MKAGVALLAKRKFVAGVHDTDYFAKLPHASVPKVRGPQPEGGYPVPRLAPFVTVPHNDTKTKGLWSAAAEFSSLFGSETVITKELLLQHGLRLEKIAEGRPNLLDEATEAWGWRGVVSTADDAPITAEVPLESVYPALKATLEWAVNETLQCISEPDRLLAHERVGRLHQVLDETYGKSANLADFYRQLLPSMYSFAAGEPLDLETTRTTELLQFNTATCHLPRFELVDHFVSTDTKGKAHEAYNEAVSGSEIYPLARFMSGAIPFDLVIPGIGRGTIRIAPRAVIIMTPQPRFISLKQPIRSIRDLAEAVEGKFGTGCTLIGKAVTLIGMLAREFVFVFHEGASSYVSRSRHLHCILREQGIEFHANPILRVRYRAWDALAECHSWLRLPSLLHGPFGAEEICAPSFAARWREVATDQDLVLANLKNLRRPIDLIAFLEHHVGTSWKCLSKEYAGLHESLEKLEGKLAALKEERRALYGKLRDAKASRVNAEKALGEHWRAKVWGQVAGDLGEREKLKQDVIHAIHAIADLRQRIRALLIRQKEVARDSAVLSIHDRRRAIEREAELKRLRLIRSGILATKGLANASLRPSAWWFPLLCPDGGWFRKTIETAEAYLEPMM